MIQFLKGNLFDSTSDILVNTVNTVGVMGKGIALEFKNRYPKNFQLYRGAYLRGELEIGKLFITKENSKLIINLPTKEHWRNKSKYSYVAEGLEALKFYLKSNPNLKSISIPALGCSNGGLDWNVVKEMIVENLSDLNLDIYVFEPNLQ